MRMPLKYTIQTFQHITNGIILQDKPNYPVIKYLLFDSRNIIFPKYAAFFAIPGPRKDGHTFIKELYEKGVRNFIISDEKYSDGCDDANFLLVKDTIQSLQSIGQAHRELFDIPIIGITGSNGKTIVKEWLFQLLHESYKIVRSPKSYNSQLGVPLSTWNINSTHNLGIFEAGISEVGEMEKLSPIINCTIGILTSLGSAHNEGFQHIEEKLSEKLILFEHARAIVFPGDDPLIYKLITEKFKHKKLISWGRGEHVALRITGTRIHQKKKIIEAVYNGEPQTITIPFTDLASMENAISCWATLLHLGMHGGDQSFQKLEPVAMRLELKGGINNCQIINDSYNADINGLQIALDFMSQQKQYAKRTLILSDILQSGKDGKQLYRSIAELLGDQSIHRVIGIGKEITDLREFIETDLEQEYFQSTQEFLGAFSRNSFQDELILIKGARQYGFEQIAAKLVERTHKTVMEVNLDAIVRNLSRYGQFLNAETKIMVMVKAFAYGGGIEVAKLLEYLHVSYLAVAFVDEGIELRQRGLQTPMMVLNPDAASFDSMIEYNLEPEIYSFSILEQVLKVPANQELGIHIKIDTGMHRLGFNLDEIQQLGNLLIKHPAIKVKSIFSHLAASEVEKEDEFTLMQITSFKKAAEELVGILGYKPILHILNTTGVVRFPQFQMDMVRLGIGLFGVDYSEQIQNQLSVVNTLKTIVSQVRSIDANESVGYSRNGRSPEARKIATIPIGYADGLPRQIGNGKYALLVRNQPAKIVGNVCMDMCMLDVTDIEGVEAGDEVVVFGEEPTVQFLAKSSDTIVPQLFTGITDRVKRVYFRE